MAWNASNAAVFSGPRAFAIGCKFIDRCLAPLPVTKECYKVFALIHLDQLPLFRIFLLLFLTYLSAWYLDSICFAMSTFSSMSLNGTSFKTDLNSNFTSAYFARSLIVLKSFSWELGFSTRLSSPRSPRHSGDSKRQMPGLNAHLTTCSPRWRGN